MDEPTPAAVPNLAGADRFSFAATVFLRLLSLTYLVAFASYWLQLDGLVGPHGLLPAERFFSAVRAQEGAKVWWELPSLCWIFAAGRFLHVLCAAGIVISFLLFAGLAPALSLGLLWTGYLTLVGAGQLFYSFQWDSLLLETTLLAVFLTPWSWLPLWRPVEPPRVARWLLWWLLIRLMLLSGAVKLTSGDPAWRNLTALTFHYETQPLPTPIAWFAHQLPAWVQTTSCAIMFAVELGAPLLLMAPRRLRHPAALALIGFMLLIALTGNYTFFDFLAIALCVLCLDDAWWSRWFRPPLPAATARHVPAWLLVPFAAGVFVFTFVQATARLTRGASLPAGYWKLEQAVDGFRSLNSYGLFAVMTTTRPELIIEGSDDGRDWLAYELPHKPGDLARRPDFVAPYQPRLDWQLWFAALEEPRENPWVFALCEHLLRGTSEVLGLFARNPFPGHPPRFIRVVRYEYHFTTPAERAATGRWWRRTPLDYYVEPISLR